MLKQKNLNDIFRIAWANYIAYGKKIEFVKSNLVLQKFNSSNDAKGAFADGTPVSSINPAEGEECYSIQYQGNDCPYGEVGLLVSCLA